MKMPGFTAEASLLETVRFYGGQARARAFDAVTPQISPSRLTCSQCPAYCMTFCRGTRSPVCYPACMDKCQASYCG
jgi:hypothetical protein